MASMYKQSTMGQRHRDNFFNLIDFLRCVKYRIDATCTRGVVLPCCERCWGEDPRGKFAVLQMDVFKCSLMIFFAMKVHLVTRVLDGGAETY
jgi:hypothetical protein